MNFLSLDLIKVKADACKISSTLIFLLYFMLEVAIDSRLSPAKVRWRQPAVSSELSLVTAS